MPKWLSATAFTLLLLAPATGLAQQQPPQPPPPTFIPRPVLPPPLEQPRAIQGEIFRENLTRQAAINSPERRSRARRVGVLVDRGACREAEQVARREGDRMMANRVAEVCVAGEGIRPQNR